MYFSISQMYEREILFVCKIYIYIFGNAIIYKIIKETWTLSSKTFQRKYVTWLYFVLNSLIYCQCR